MQTSMGVGEARKIVGGLGSPSKMPGHSYGLPTRACQIGMLLAKQTGTTCSHCYADKRGMYRFDTVQACQERRLASLSDPRWVEAMVIAIRATRDSHFRWHDSGDLQSPAHLGLIAQVARALPHIQFWLPTREYGHVGVYMAENTVPANLTIRLSAHKLDTAPPEMHGLPGSGVRATTTPVMGQTCPAPEQNNKCGECRACWNPDIRVVWYHRH